MICQLNSALARADTYVREALLAIHQRDYTLASAKLGGALSALEYAGNSQTKLIDAANAAEGLILKPWSQWVTGDQKDAVDGLRDAIAHASGPGID